MKEPPIGVMFEPVYECTRPKIDRLLEALSTAQSADLIYHNEQVDIYRFFTEIKSRPVYICNVTFIAQLIDTERFMVSSGIIRSCELRKVPDHEKIGKRMLYNALISQWNIRF